MTHEKSATGLKSTSVGVRFDGIVALDDVSLEVSGTEVVGLIGPNGAGKTTLVNVLTGFQKPTTGSVSVNGTDIAGTSPNHVSRLGLARTFQSARLFNGLSVYDNLRISAYGGGRFSEGEACARADELIEFLDISPLAYLAADALSYGDSRRVGIGRALATRPNFVLMDEPAAGMSEPECEALIEVINRIPEGFGCAIVLIEHNISLVMRVCQRLHVLDSGKTLATGTPEEMQRNEAVLAAYLGG